MRPIIIHAHCRFSTFVTMTKSRLRPLELADARSQPCLSLVKLATPFSLHEKLHSWLRRRRIRFASQPKGVCELHMRSDVGTLAQTSFRESSWWRLEARDSHPHSEAVGRNESASPFVLETTSWEPSSSGAFDAGPNQPGRSGGKPEPCLPLWGPRRR